MLRRSIAASTRRWIDEFVVKEKLCPFAKSSSIRIHVHAFADDHDDALLAKQMKEQWRLDPLNNPEDAALAMAALGRARSEVDAVIEAAVHDPASSTANLFLVWPAGLGDYSAFAGFAAALGNLARLGSGSGGPEGDFGRATAFPFHPTLLQPRDSVTGAPSPSLRHALREANGNSCSSDADYKFASPFPMLHIIPRPELVRARRQLSRQEAHRGGGQHLLDRNQRLMRDATVKDQARWEELLAECRQV